MQQSTISKPAYTYIKLKLAPHDSTTTPVDRATLHILLTRAMTEMYGRVGAGAMSGLGDGVEVLLISNSSMKGEENGSAREVILRVVSSAATQLIATLPFSSASELYSVEFIGSSPLCTLAKAAHSAADQPGSITWLQRFESV